MANAENDCERLSNLKGRMDTIEIERASGCAGLIRMSKLSGGMSDGACRRGCSAGAALSASRKAYISANNHGKFSN
jgi:hypothetical protein